MASTTFSPIAFQFRVSCYETNKYIADRDKRNTLDKSQPFAQAFASFYFRAMIAKLSSFADQFDAQLVETGKALFDKGAIGNLTKVEDNWYATVTDTKNYKVTVNEEDGSATAVFCPCGPAICRHVIGVFYALKKRLKIKTEAFDPSSLDPEPAILLGWRLNDMVYTSRAAGSKNGELEKQGETVTLKEPNMASLRAMVKKGLMWPHEHSRYPILTGAQRLLGKAIHKYAEKDYVYVYTIARAILTEICSSEEDYISSAFSARECARAAVEVLNTLCTDTEVPAELRKEVLSRVVFACKKELYEAYHKELLAILVNPALDPELQESAQQELQNIASLGSYTARTAIEMQHDLLKQQGKEEELQQLRLANPQQFRQELIEQAYEQKNYTRVKELALDGLTYTGRDTNACKDWLLKVAEIENDVVYIRTYYRDKYFSTDYADKYYEICRSSYTTEEWVKQLPDWESRFRRDVMTGLSSNSVYALAKIYLREEMDSKLLAFLQKHRSFELAQLAEPLLIRNHADALMQIYRDWFIQTAENSTQRDRASHLRELMIKVRRGSPQGRQMIKELVPHLLQLHPTWKVFGEEISKLHRGSYQ